VSYSWTTRDMSDTAVPRTPNALDISLSKRMWEREVMNWRTSLKRWFGDKKESVDDVAHQSA
jgi:hypothetical protein